MKHCIALYGIGTEGEKFYFNYKDTCEICYVIDRQNQRTFHGKSVYTLDEALGEKQKVLIVVACGKNIYLEIREVLENKGLVEFQDFIWYEYIDKKMVILYGNCHMSGIESYLMSNPYFRQQYYVKRFCVTEEVPTKEELQACGVLICQDINDNNKLGVPSYDKLFELTKDECVKILIPNLFGLNLFFPQIYESEEWKRHLRNDGYDGEVYQATVRRIGIPDENIRQLWKEGKSIDEIVDIIQNKDVYQGSDILEDFNAKMHKLKSREEKCDIKISDYIEGNYRSKKLFFEPGHPTGDVLTEKGRRICSFLSVPIEESCLVNCNIDTVELFTYGCVKRALQLDFEEKHVRNYDCSATIGNRPLDIREYVRQSIIWLYQDEEVI